MWEMTLSLYQFALQALYDTVLNKIPSHLHCDIGMKLLNPAYIVSSDEEKIDIIMDTGRVEQRLYKNYGMIIDDFEKELNLHKVVTEQDEYYLNRDIQKYFHHCIKTLKLKVPRVKRIRVRRDDWLILCNGNIQAVLPIKPQMLGGDVVTMTVEEWLNSD